MVSTGIITLQLLYCSFLSQHHSSGSAYARPFGGPKVNQIEELNCLENNPRNKVLAFNSLSSSIQLTTQLCKKISLAQQKKNKQA